MRHIYLQRFQRRLRAILRNDQMLHFAPFMKRLGVDGMSSDEEDCSDPARTRLKILKKRWRSSSVTSLMRIADALHRRWRSTQGDGPLRGAQPLDRYLSDEFSASGGPVAVLPRPVAGLPRNAYEDRWLTSLSTVRQSEINAIDVALDFTIR